MRRSRSFGGRKSLSVDLRSLIVAAPKVTKQSKITFYEKEKNPLYKVKYVSPSP